MAVCAWVVTIAQFTVVFFATTKQRTKLYYYWISRFLHPVRSNDCFIQTLFCHVCYLYSCSEFNHRGVLHKDLPNHSSTQHCSRSIVRRGNSSYGVEEAKITRMLTVAVVGFYLCWLPLLISNTLLSLDLLGENAFKYQNFYHTFPLFASSAINPMVYGTMSQSFRNEFLKILRRQP